MVGLWQKGVVDVSAPLRLFHTLQPGSAGRSRIFAWYVQSFSGEVSRPKRASTASAYGYQRLARRTHF